MSPSCQMSKWRPKEDLEAVPMAEGPRKDAALGPGAAASPEHVHPLTDVQ